MTGFYRDGFCRTGPEDLGLHTVCVKVTREFLDFSVLDGNDLVTPHPEWGFPGLDWFCKGMAPIAGAPSKGRSHAFRKILRTARRTIPAKTLAGKPEDSRPRYQRFETAV
jgi:uncharacterized protein (DUF2237 family)